MKDIIVKIWPEITSYLPVLTNIPSNYGKRNKILFDFSYCTDISSTGLTILLINILKRLKLTSDPKKNWRAEFKNNPIEELVAKLGFLEIIKNYVKADDLLIYENPFSHKLSKDEYYNHKNIHSYPIYVFDFSKTENNREVLDDFIEWLDSILTNYENKYFFHKEMFITILKEIGKNSADHSMSKAFFGLDIIHDNEKIKLNFSFGDLGLGIKQHIQNIFSAKVPNRKAHWSLYESYYHACKPGFTSKPRTEINRGIGMTIIIEGSQSINLELSIFDTKSRGILSNFTINTHAELRKLFFNIGHDVAFCYYGELLANKI